MRPNDKAELKILSPSITFPLYNEVLWDATCDMIDIRHY